MNPDFDRARELVAKAREALRRGDNATARALGEQASLLAPAMEDAWLILAASDPSPQDANAYARKALEINLRSPRARKGVEWTEGRLKQAKVGGERVASVRSEAPSGIPIIRESHPEKPAIEPKQNSRVILYAGTLGLLACIVFVFASWSAVSSPAFASILDSAPAPAQENLWAPAEIAKPSVTPLDVGAPVVQAPATSTPVVIADTPVPAPSYTPSALPTDAPTSTPAATETPGVLAMDIVPDTPTSAYVPPTYAPPAAPAAPSETRGGVRWIDVDLTNQMVYAYEGDTVVNSFVVSTGTWLTPTVTGKYKIWIKLKKTSMSGPGYYLADVPYVMYFYKGYGLHGTYWHNNFGTPMSHGCVNLRISDAEWLYYWASEGTVVNVHY